MGASSFMTSAKGKNAHEAFNNARAEATYDRGHEAYSGTIKEKQTFKEFSLPSYWEKTPLDYANSLMNDGVCMGKSGPAGCILVKCEETIENVPYKASIEKIPNKETRKWETVYVLSGPVLHEAIYEFKKQGDAETAAKELALKHNAAYVICIEKKLMNAPTQIAIARPITKEVRIPNGMKTYLFFGMASS